MATVQDILDILKGHAPTDLVDILDATPKNYQFVFKSAEPPVNSVEAETIQEEPKAEEGVA